MEIKKLLSEKEITKIIKRLSGLILNYYKGKRMTIVCILEGGRVVNDLLVAEFLRMDPYFIFQIVYAKVETYKGNKRVRKPKIIWQDDPHHYLNNRDVLILDDIIDSGYTLHGMRKGIQVHEPTSISTCVLLDKFLARIIPFEPSYVGHFLGSKDAFVVGMGMDYNGKYRDLPYIGVISDE